MFYSYLKTISGERKYYFNKRVRKNIEVLRGLRGRVSGTRKPRFSNEVCMKTQIPSKFLGCFKNHFSMLMLNVLFILTFSYLFINFFLFFFNTLYNINTNKKVHFKLNLESHLIFNPAKASLKVVSLNQRDFFFRRLFSSPFFFFFYSL